MPMAHSTQKLADGRPYLHLESSGRVTGEEARALMARMSPGGDLTGLPLLAVMESKVDMEPEARKAFASLNNGDKPIKVALVTASAPLRVVLNFVIKLSPQINETKFFSNSAEALAWLEKR